MIGAIVLIVYSLIQVCLRARPARRNPTQTGRRRALREDGCTFHPAETSNVKDPEDFDGESAPLVFAV